MTLTSKRLLLSGQGSFPPMEIPLSAVTLVMIKNESLNRGYADGNALEVTYPDQSGKLHWVSLLPPDIEKWVKEIQTAASLGTLNSPQYFCKWKFISSGKPHHNLHFCVYLQNSTAFSIYSLISPSKAVESLGREMLACLLPIKYTFKVEPLTLAFLKSFNA